MASGVPLGGVDVFHWMNDRAMVARGLPGNHCIFVIELDGRLDPAALGRRLSRAVEALPELSYRLGPWPFWPLRWQPGPPPSAPLVQVHTAKGNGDRIPVDTLDALLALRVDGRHPWALDLVRGPSRDALVLRWFHPLVDAKGAERLVRWLGAGGPDGPAPPPPIDQRSQRAERAIASRDRRARIDAMRAYNRHVIALGETPILSPASGHASPSRARPRNRFVRIELSEEETRAFDRSVRERAKLAESSFLIVACARAVDALLVARGWAPPRYAVPIPLSLDPKVGSERMVGNNLTMMMFALDRASLRDEARAIAALADQQRSIVRQKLDVGMIAALDFARWLPPLPYRWVTARPFGGEMGSFIFSNPGALTIDSFADVPVVDAYAVPTVVSPPGIQMTFTRFRGRLSGMIAWVEPDVSEREAESLIQRIRASMGGAS